MATDIREVLSKYVPAAVLDEAVEEIRDTDIAPDWFRQEVAKLGADAKEAQTLRERLESIESAPQRKEAFKQVGISDYDRLPRSVRKTFDAVPADKLGDLDYLAGVVKEEGIEAELRSEEAPREKSGAETITEFLTAAGQGAPVRTGQEAANQAFYDELDRVPDGDKEAVRAVLAKHGRLASDHG